MSPADTLTADPVAEPEDSTPASPEESASQSEPTDDISPESRARMNDLIRGLGDQSQDGSASKPRDADDEDDGAARDGESAPTGDVKPSDQSGQPGRRGAAARIAALEAENARLQRLYDEANPPPPDASEAERTAILSREHRYRTLAAKPWDDQDWTQEDIDFFQGEQKRRAVAPELQRHFETVVAEDLRTNQRWLESQNQGFQAYVLGGMESIKDLPGVDFEAIKAAPDFVARERLIYQAGAASNEPELKRLREENAEYRRDLLGATRAPVGAGRSSPGRTFSANDVMNTIIRGGRA